MHQDHNIPWSIPVKHIKWRQENPFLEGKRGTNLFRNKVTFELRDLPSQAKDMNHFMSKFIKALTDFSITERAKYPDKPTVESRGKMFSDDYVEVIRQQNPRSDAINQETQKIEAWLKHVPARADEESHWLRRRLSEFSEARHYAAAVSILLGQRNREELASLLMLSHHPKCDVGALFSFQGRFDVGFVKGLSETLASYILLNLLYAMPGMLDNKRYMHTKGFSRKAREVCWGVEHVDRYVHNAFWLENSEHNHGLVSKAVFDDLDAVQEYLKRCWRILYRYDMLMRECEITEPWETYITEYFDLHFKFKTRNRDPTWDGERWIANESVAGFG